MTKEEIKSLFERIYSWPEEDQQELIEIARQIEAERTGVYVLSEDEHAAIDEARRSGIATEEEVEAAFKSFRGE